MKDLITSIGAIMILMVFVMQFCADICAHGQKRKSDENFVGI